MIYKSIRLQPYELKLRKPFITSKSTYLKSNGFFIILTMDDLVGYGEVSPLPDFSKENLQQILWAFELLKPALIKEENYNYEDILQIFELYAIDLPSLHFGLDTAASDLWSKKNNLSLCKYLNKDALDRVNFSSIYLHNNEMLVNKYVKIKFGTDSLSNDLKKIKNISKKLPTETIFRVDANKAYSLDDAIFLFHSLKQFNVEYVEEPLKNLSIENLTKLKQNTNLSIALDESFIKQDCMQYIANQLIKYVVIKPSIYGGYKKLFKIKEFLSKSNIEVIISSSLENHIGNMASIHITSAMQLNHHHGINNNYFYDFKSELVFSKEDLNINLSKFIGLGAIV